MFGNISILELEPKMSIILNPSIQKYHVLHNWVKSLHKHKISSAVSRGVSLLHRLHAETLFNGGVCCLTDEKVMLSLGGGVIINRHGGGGNLGGYHHKSQGFLYYYYNKACEIGKISVLKSRGLQFGLYMKSEGPIFLHPTYAGSLWGLLYRL